jgi:ATP-dependent helicase/nuclease subunit A
MSAYLVNDRLVPDADFYRVACDPQVPVVVEACAGAGKTWMLVSRIVRALLEGVEPSQILAITFTRKAAGEMRERLQGLLRELALAHHEERVKQLKFRGLDEARAQALAPQLAAVYERTLTTGQSVQVSTIHGWFSRLLRAAPLDTLSQLGLPPQLKLLSEDEVDPWPTLWGRLLKRVDADEAELREAFVRLMRSERRHNLEAWLQAALSNRLEITLADAHGHLWGSVPSAQECLPEWAEHADPLQALGSAQCMAQTQALASEMGKLSGVNATTAAASLVDALSTQDLSQRLALMRQAVLTQGGEPRKNISKTLVNLPAFQEWLQGLNQALAQNEAMQMHQDMVTLSRVLFEVYEAFKREGGYIDMVDLERGADHLLRDETLAAWVQQRLDQQLRHVLIDEFQDTSPLQWRALREWLASYAGAGGGSDIKVFIVGDPKQSIYRFRRAEPRVFLAAKDFVSQTLGGALLACDHTRRNAPGIIHGLNQVMAPLAAAGSFTGFRPHTTASTDLHQWLSLPDVLRPPRAERGAAKAQSEAWRDSLTQARHLPDEVLREQEAEHCAEAIASLMTTQGKQPQDFFILARKRQSLLLAAQALAKRGIAHAAPQDTLLAETAEAKDLLAVLQAVVSPVHELALAHALKTPGLDVGDEGLMRLARMAKTTAPLEGGRWWAALQAQRQTLDSLFDDDTTQRLRRAATLLEAWRRAAGLLPPHDLMQRIVDDCDWRGALARQLSPPMCRQALLHLDAMLNQSLMLRGGRDATPYRWVRELRRLKTPLPTAISKGAVQLLTIHGAKGLEADVVFLMDTDGEPARSDHHLVLVDWQPEDEAPARCAFLVKESAPPPSMRTWMDAERQARYTEECNALYVALTRARRALYFSRTEPSRTHPHGSWWEALNRSGALNETMRWALPEGAHGPAKRPGEPEVNALPRLPHLPNRALTAPVAMPPEDPERAELARLGKAVHRVLEMITTRPWGDRTPKVREALARQAWRTVNQEEARPEPLTDARLQRLMWQVDRVLDHPDAQPWLDPALVEWAANELVLWQDGRPIRIDRLVRRITPAGREWWVLDYKLSESPETLAAYRDQMHNYLRAVKALSGGEPVLGAFITGTGEFHAL